MLTKKCQILIVNFFDTQKAIQIEVNFNFGWLFLCHKSWGNKKSYSQRNVHQNKTI